MARMQVDQGVKIVACTPHISPRYPNTVDQIIARLEQLRIALAEADIPLQLASGADNHVTPDFAAKLRNGNLLTLGGTRYVLVEPIETAGPVGISAVFDDLLANGYVPVFTHPERMRWISEKYDLIEQLAARGVWMQITAGSLTGQFGSRARKWAERMLSEGLVQLLASDAHHPQKRPPNLDRGRLAAEQLLGPSIAQDLVVTGPTAIVENADPDNVNWSTDFISLKSKVDSRAQSDLGLSRGGFVGRMRSVLTGR